MCYTMALKDRTVVGRNHAQRLDVERLAGHLHANPDILQLLVLRVGADQAHLVVGQRLKLGPEQPVQEGAVGK